MLQHSRPTITHYILANSRYHNDIFAFAKKLENYFSVCLNIFNTYSRHLLTILTQSFSYSHFSTFSAFHTSLSASAVIISYSQHSSASTVTHQLLSVTLSHSLYFQLLIVTFSTINLTWFICCVNF